MNVVHRPAYLTLSARNRYIYSNTHIDTVIVTKTTNPILHDTAGIASLVGHFSWWTEGSLELEPVTAAGVTILSPYCNITPIDQDRLGKHFSLANRRSI